MPVGLPQRECRPCDACCIHLSIPSGQLGPGAKPPGIECPHLSSTGCRVYSRRNQLCADFRCAWLCDERWPESWRPDHSGLMCLRESLDAHWIGALVYEIRPDCLQTPLGAEIIDQLRNTSSIVAVVDFQGHRTGLRGQRIDPPQARSPRRPYFLSPDPTTKSDACCFDPTSDARG